MRAPVMLLVLVVAAAVVAPRAVAREARVRGWRSHDVLKGSDAEEVGFALSAPFASCAAPRCLGELVDFDGDGRPDFPLKVQSSTDLWCGYATNVHGGASAVVTVLPYGTGMRSYAVLDVDMDGLVDWCFAAENDAAHIKWYKNNGKDFYPPRTLDLQFSNSDGMTGQNLLGAMDINADGNLDLIFSLANEAGVYGLAWADHGNNWTTHTIVIRNEIIYPYVASLLPSNFSADSNPTFVYMPAGLSEVDGITTTDNGVSWSTWSAACSYSNRPGAILSIDFDKDGVNELVATNFAHFYGSGYDDTLRVYRFGVEGFEDQPYWHSSFMFHGDSPYSIDNLIVGNVFSSSKVADVIAVHEGAPEPQLKDKSAAVDIYRSASTSNVVTVFSTLGSLTRGVIVSDVNGDGADDIILLTKGNNYGKKPSRLLWIENGATTHFSGRTKVILFGCIGSVIGLVMFLFAVFVIVTKVVKSFDSTQESALWNRLPANDEFPDEDNDNDLNDGPDGANLPPPDPATATYPPWNTKLQLGVYCTALFVTAGIILGGNGVPYWWLVMCPGLGTCFVLFISPLSTCVLLEDTACCGRRVLNSPHGSGFAIAKRFALLLALFCTAFISPFLYYVNLMLVCWDANDERCPSDTQIRVGGILVMVMIASFCLWGMYMTYELILLFGRTACVRMLAERRRVASSLWERAYHGCFVGVFFAALLTCALGGWRILLLQYRGVVALALGALLLLVEVLCVVPGARQLPLSALQMFVCPLFLLAALYSNLACAALLFLLFPSSAPLTQSVA
eukprot:TRINITY_DN5177_c0_g1_i2.p1 TRINITY_DN5177_c0_g1~~TRINITY_DN5177_c0_g1_i2.p1  ORF type:complete len:809 (-),score=144.06 TRINITY_DN5177_c0_g1_i2:21-2390(-)